MEIILWFILAQIIFIGLLVVGWLIRNLIIKNKKQEEILRKQSEYLLSIYEAVNLAEKKIIEIDKAQIFQGDDEIGWYFKLIKDIQEQLFTYTKFIQ